MKAGDRVRWRRPASKLEALDRLAMGDVEMTVLRTHPKLAHMVEVQGPDGYATWVAANDLRVIDLIERIGELD